MIKIEIDGVEVEAEAGSMIIQVADRMQISIPRFCYHPKLSIAANCRMCLIQVEKVPKALPACATPIAEGMKIWTKSKTAIDAQKSVMEFLLINHPLDCPICDQGGECELQDISMDYGRDISRYTEEKRVVLDKNIGSLIATDMTRCIQCTRCVRFGEEIAGERELGATGRGEFVKITTFVEQSLQSEVSGNVIDLCPVGALTSKPFRFSARAWELDEHCAVSPHDCIGSNLHLHVRNNTVMRVVPKTSDALNETWLADRDRFSYEGLLHDERLRKPMLRKQDRWVLVSWAEALNYALEGVKLSVDTYGGEQLGTLASPNATVEEYYLLQQLVRGLGSNNIDHRLRQLDFSQQELAALYPNLGIEFKDLENQDSILLIGTNIHKEQPIAGLKLRKAALKGAKICAVNPVDFNFNFLLAARNTVAGADMLSALAGIAKELLNLKPEQATPGASKLLGKIQPSVEQQQVAAAMLNGSKHLIILGQLALMHPQASILIQLSALIAKLIDGKYGSFSDGANAAGAWLTGCVPHRLPGGKTSNLIGKNALEMLQQPLRCYILYAIEPEFDSLLGEQTLEILAQADFVVVFSSYQSEALLKIADVLLPLAAFSEISGTTVNIDGMWQSFTNVVHPFDDSRPGWKILRVLGNFAGLSNFNYESTDEVLTALHQEIGTKHPLTTWQTALPNSLDVGHTKSLVRVAPIALYAVDSLVRRSACLQATGDANANPSVEINPDTAKYLGIANGDLLHVKTAAGATKVSAIINPAVGENTVLLNQANAQTNCLGAPYSTVEISLCLS